MLKRRALSQHEGDSRWDLILRLTASAQLRGSPRLCELLLYVSDCALRDSPEEVSEQQIGIRVFGRAPGFNSSDDSIVRTQVRLLRQKMGAYFAGEGNAEPLIVDIPKGHYLPVFREAGPGTAFSPADAMPGPDALQPTPPQLNLVNAATNEIRNEVQDEIQPVELPLIAPKAAGDARAETRWSMRPRLPQLLVLAALGLIVATVATVLLLRHRQTTAPSSVLTLWRPFLTDEPPLVIYSNALFEGDSKTGLRYAASDEAQQQPPPAHLTDHYTGVGEVVSVYQLTRFFDSQHATFMLKRSRLVAWDEAKLRNLIFIGAPAENGSMRVLPPASDFSMTTGDGFASIVNLHPLKGEPAVLSRPEYPLTRDYAILAQGPGIEPGRHTLVLSGLTTLGTEAAAEFACRPESVAQLLKAVGYTSGEVRPFEAVLEVSVGGGVPLQSRIVLLHVH